MTDEEFKTIHKISNRALYLFLVAIAVSWVLVGLFVWSMWATFKG